MKEKEKCSYLCNKSCYLTMVVATDNIYKTEEQKMVVKEEKWFCYFK